MKDSNQKTYFIAVKDAVTQLETIAVASGSDIVPGSTRHYYLPVPPNTLITVTISAADRVKNNVQYMEYADALQFAAASFIEIFPKGVKVLSVGAPYNDDFTIIQIPSGPDKGKYQVSGDIQGLVLKIKKDASGNSMTNSSGVSRYELLYSPPSDGDTSTFEPVPNIVIKVQYTATTGTIERDAPGLFHSSINFDNNSLYYTDYFGINGSSGAQNYEQKIYIRPDII